MSERVAHAAVTLPRQRETEPPDYRARVRRAAAVVLEAVNEGDPTILVEFAHPGVRDLSDDRLFDDGIAGLRFAIDRARRVMPDIHGRILRIGHTTADTVSLDVEFTATYLGTPLAPTHRHGRQARWRQHHEWVFLGTLACAHIGTLDRATLRTQLGDPH